MADFAVTEYEIACDYESSLQELTSNSKPHINMLTMLAEENQRYARKIVEIIENRLLKVTSNHKLPLLYLMDSIIKNCQKTNYRDEFAKTMPTVLSDVLRTGDEKTKTALRKLRSTWTSLFSAAQLQELDVRMHETDPTWHVHKQAKQILLSSEDIFIINTSVAQAQSKTITVDPDLPSPVPRTSLLLPAEVPHQFPNSSTAFDLSIVKREPPAEEESEPPADNNRRTSTIVDSGHSTVKQEPPEENGVGASDQSMVISSGHNETDQSPLAEFSSQSESLSFSEHHHTCEIDEADELANQRRQFEEILLLAAYCPPPPPPPPREQPPLRLLKQEQPVVTSSNLLLNVKRENGNNDIDAVSTIESKVNFDVNSNRSTPAHISPTPTPSLSTTSAFFTSRCETPIDSRMPTPASTPVVYDASKSGGQSDSSVPPPPANNKIFVDGRPYEVRFIGDSAVIERSGLPHTVSFVGKPKDVVIDGVPHKVPFGGEPKEVLIDGRMLKIRFGAPSRELYIGSVPLRGAFGGPPMFAAINGVKHKIQLCGPPPEVKIDSEPSYELLRFMHSSHRTAGAPAHDYSAAQEANKMRLPPPHGSAGFGHVMQHHHGQTGHVMTPTNQIQPSSAAGPTPSAASSVIITPQLAGFLAQLRFPSVATSSVAPTTTPTFPVSSFPSTAVSTTDEHVIEKRPYPLSSLCEFNMNSFKM